MLQITQHPRFYWAFWPPAGLHCSHLIWSFWGGFRRGQKRKSSRRLTPRKLPQREPAVESFEQAQSGRTATAHRPHARARRRLTARDVNFSRPSKRRSLKDDARRRARVPCVAFRLPPRLTRVEFSQGAAQKRATPRAWVAASPPFRPCARPAQLLRFRFPEPPRTSRFFHESPSCGATAATLAQPLKEKDGHALRTGAGR